MQRIEREKQVVGQMIAIYCRHHHKPTDNSLCPGCAMLSEYAVKRLSLCPKGNRKGSCRKCQIHCYAPSFKARIREVMRWSGPRMLYMHPVSAIRHLLADIK